MSIHLHHVSLIVSDASASATFYSEVIGLRIAERIPLNFAGVWLQAGEQQIHLLEVPNPDPVTGRPTHGGRDRHIAFAVDDLSAVTQKLDQLSIPYTLSQSGRQALFCRDPDGNAIELIQTT